MLKSNLSLSLNYNLSISATESFFKPEISSFLYSQTGIVEEFRILDAEAYISSYDFKDPQIVSVEYIYLNFLDQISSSKNSLNIPISVFITFDKRQCTEYCDKSGRSYSSIKVGGVSKVYYILFNTDEVYDFIYSKEISYNKEAEISTYCYGGDLEYQPDENIENSGVTVLPDECVKGYLDNHNVDRGLSYVSCTDDSGYPIYHKDFPKILELAIGSIVELDIDYSCNFGRVVGYNELKDKEIEGLIQFFDGVLQKRGLNAYINTDLDAVKTIFVPSNIAIDYEENNHIRVVCLARNKKPLEIGQYEWVALKIEKNNKIIS